MLDLGNLFTRDGQRADQALEFLRRLRPRSPWTLITQGGGPPEVASFLPTIAEQVAAARSWIVGRQRKGRSILVLLGDTAQPPQRHFTEEEIVGSSVIAIEVTGRPDELQQRLTALPTPSAVIHTGRALAALYLTRAPLPIGTVIQIATPLARRCAGQHFWLLPLPGTLRSNGRQVKIVRYDPARLITAADLEEGASIRRRRVTLASQVAPANIDWLWRHMIPRGELTLIAGFGSAGKTTMCLGLAAAISRGAAWPDGTPAPLGRAMIIEGEDPVDTVTVPRLIAAGADLHRITLVDQGEEMLTAQDLEEASAGVADLRLVVLSPIRRLIHDNQATNTEIRRRLEPLIEWARARRVGLIGIMHPQKGNKTQSADAFAGSPAYTELCRSAHLATIDEDDDEPIDILKRRKLVSVKTNIAPVGISYSYRIETAHAGEIETSRVVWIVPGVAPGVTPGSANTPPQPEQNRSFPVRSEPATPPRYKTASQAWLAAQLADGPRLAADLERDGKTAGHERATLYRAAAALGVRRETLPGGSKRWHLGNG